MSHEATELELYIENTRGVWEGFAEPVERNLKRKLQRGEYDHEKAEKAWKRVVDRAAQEYRREHCSIAEKWYEVFPIEGRCAVARNLADYFLTEYSQGNK